MARFNWLPDALRWMRDQFAAWFASSFVMAALFAVIIASMVIGMGFDGAYAERWAPSDVWRPWFRFFGWCVSFFMILGTAAGVLAWQKGAKVAGAIMFSAGIFFTLLSVTQSIGVVALKANEMAARSDAYTTQAEAVETSDDNRLEELKGQRENIRTGRDSEIERIEASIAAIRDDGVRGIGGADLEKIDKLNQDIATLRTDADAEIKMLSELILDEFEAPTTQSTETLPPHKYDPLIEVLSYLMTGGAADDRFKDGLTIIYLSFWSLGCPIMGQMLSCYLVIVRHNARQYAPDTIWIDGKAYDSDWLAQAAAHRESFEEGLQRGRETRERNAQREVTAGYISDHTWSDRMRERIWELHKEGMSPEDIANEIGYSKSELSALLLKLFNAEDIHKIKSVGAEDDASTIAAE